MISSVVAAQNEARTVQARDEGSRRVRLFGAEIDAVNMAGAVERVYRWLETDALACHYVVTPNVDHLVLLREDEAFRRAYEQADMVVADGAPIVLASRLLGSPLPERVAGVDLALEVLSRTTLDRPIRVYLMGGMPGVGQRAAEEIVKRWPGVQIVGVDSPPWGFERNAAETERAIARVSEHEPDLLLLGLGSPKQENWVNAHRAQLRCRVALCVGATIDFLAGEQRRAPGWMRSCGIEWLFRLLSAPRRLGPRYARDAWIFPQIVGREWLTRRRNSSRQMV